MAVLVTAIHVFPSREDVDARDKPAYDGGGDVGERIAPRGGADE
jgi:hypothetical protein